jgi:hypothetical protein
MQQKQGFCAHPELVRLPGRSFLPMYVCRPMNLHVSPSMNDLAAPDFLKDGGACGAVLRQRNWDATQMGAVQDWPPSLRVMLRTVLASHQPMWLWWGADMIQFHNDALIPLLGNRHPDALGLPAKRAWREGWKQIAERAQAAMAGHACFFEADALAMGRGAEEESYYTFSL